MKNFSTSVGSYLLASRAENFAKSVGQSIVARKTVTSIYIQAGGYHVRTRGVVSANWNVFSDEEGRVGERCEGARTPVDMAIRVRERSVLARRGVSSARSLAPLQIVENVQHQRVSTRNG